MFNADIGVAGLGVMGSSLAMNIETHGFTVAGWDRDAGFVDNFVRDKAAGHERVLASKDAAEFVQSLAAPRKILIMVKAGAPVDWTIEQFTPHLEAGDIIIDGGNSQFEDTRRREESLRERGIHFVGMGVSGGERGALEGASLMPGGSVESYQATEKIWQAIAAKSEFGACVTHVGADGAGHFVKMAHNGIEYGMMQAIAETYDLLKSVGGLNADALAQTFDEWNEGELNGYLIKITADIFRVSDAGTNEPLVEKVLDRAGQKGTGKWTANAAFDAGVSVPTILAAIDARIISGDKDARVRASEIYKTDMDETLRDGMIMDRDELIAHARDALHASFLCCYAQGLDLIRVAARDYEWQINLSELARIWTGGCIIRSGELARIRHAYERDAGLVNLLLDQEIVETMRGLETGWRKLVGHAVANKIPCAALTASLNYFESLRHARLPLNLTQAQRDYFGAHTYERTDSPGTFIHTDWESLAAQAK